MPAAVVDQTLDLLGQRDRALERVRFDRMLTSESIVNLITADLNGDGKVNFADVKLILDAVERVEARYPELVGGTGLYAYYGRSGPFVHIDVRGTRARWVRGVYRSRSHRSAKSRKSIIKSTKPAGASKTVSSRDVAYRPIQ